MGESAGRRERCLKRYDQLTRLGRLRRLRGVAIAALDLHEVNVAALGLVATGTNLIYRVRTAGGEEYALRIASPNRRTQDDLRLETSWLEALAEDTDIRSPRVVRAADGSPFVRVETSGVPGERLALLMSWLPGRVLSGRPTEATVGAMGALFARLHLHGAGWSPPPELTPRIFDRVFSRDEPVVLFADEQEDAYDNRSHRIIREAWEGADHTYGALDRRDLRVIHCDLWTANIKVHRGVLQPFDFEDAVRGFRLHDLAMALLDLAEDEGVTRFDELVPAMRRGYERYLAWPEGDMVALQMGRAVWRLNWIARHQREWFPAEVAFCADLFQRIKRAGKLVDPLRPG